MEKRRLRFLSILLCIMLLLALTVPAFADFGSFSGDSDYGDSGSGSDYSGWNDDDDDYYGGGTYGGGIFGGGFPLPIPIGIVIVILLYTLLSSRGSRSSSGPVVTPRASLQPIERYTELDPNFDSHTLGERISNLYVQMQNCWQDKDLRSLRPYLSDGFYQQMERQVAAMRKNHQTNYVERIAVLGVTLNGFYQAEDDDHIVATVRTRIVDYTLSDETGELISGDRRKEKFMTYEWDLVRPSGQTTRDNGGLQQINCPNCNAPLEINQSAKCPYCGTVVTLDDHDFVISSIKGISQRTA